MEVTIAGRVRGDKLHDYPPDREEEVLAMCPCGGMENSVSLPNDSELCRMGDTYLGMATAINLSTNFPSTSAHLALANWEQHDGKYYSIQYVGGWINGTLAAATTISMYVEVNTTPVASFVHDGTIKSLSGRQFYRGMGRIKSNATVTADAWHNAGTSIVSANAAANIGLAVWTPVRGRYLIPPGGCFSLTGGRSAGTVTYIPAIIWSEVSLIGGS